MVEVQSPEPGAWVVDVESSFRRRAPEGHQWSGCDIIRPFICCSILGVVWKSPSACVSAVKGDRYVHIDQWFHLEFCWHEGHDRNKATCNPLRMMAFMQLTLKMIGPTYPNFTHILNIQ
jgi:hypothetical protein